MSSVLEQDRATAPPPSRRPVPPGRQVGYVVAVACNIALLWVSHQLLDWGWPGFLTDDFTSVLPWITASFLASIVVNLALVLRDRGWFRSLTDLVTTGVSLVATLRLLEVFPFDFTGYATDWSGVVRGLLILVIGATGIAMVVHIVSLLTGGRTD